MHKPKMTEHPKLANIVRLDRSVRLDGWSIIFKFNTRQIACFLN